MAHPCWNTTKTSRLTAVIRPGLCALSILSAAANGSWGLSVLPPVPFPSHQGTVCTCHPWTNKLLGRARGGAWHKGKKKAYWFPVRDTPDSRNPRFAPFLLLCTPFLVEYPEG